MKLLLALMSGWSLWTEPVPRSEREYYVEVAAPDARAVADLAQQGFDVGGVDLDRGTATLVLPHWQLAQADGLRVVSTRLITPPDEGFHTPAEVAEVLYRAESAYPHLVRVERIGSSVEGKPLLAALVTARFVSGSEPKPAVLFDGMHHAREVMTPEVLLDLLEYLTSRYDTDADVQKWVNDYEIWVVPMLNPDGNNKVWTSASMWRKNTQGGYGVDVNRNYPYAWNTCNGSSGNKQSETYRGPSAGSEPETQAIMALTGKIRPVYNVSYHSYSEIVIYPFGCSPKKIPSPDREIYEGVGKELASRLVRDTGSGAYRAGTSYELLYDVDGGSVDWMYATHRVISFVVEVNSSAQGFQPSFTSWRKRTVEAQREGWKYILGKMSDGGLPEEPESGG